MGNLFRLQAKKTVQAGTVGITGDYRFEGSERDVLERRKEIEIMNTSPYSDVRYENIVMVELPEDYTNEWIYRTENKIRELEKKLKEKKQALQKKKQLLRNIKK